MSTASPSNEPKPTRNPLGVLTGVLTGALESSLLHGYCAVPLRLPTASVGCRWLGVLRGTREYSLVRVLRGTIVASDRQRRAPVGSEYSGVLESTFVRVLRGTVAASNRQRRLPATRPRERQVGRCCADVAKYTLVVVYIYASMYVWMHVCMHVYVCVCMCMYARVLMYACMYACM